MAYESLTKSSEATIAGATGTPQQVRLLPLELILTPPGDRVKLERPSRDTQTNHASLRSISPREGLFPGAGCLFTGWCIMDYYTFYVAHTTREEIHGRLESLSSRSKVEQIKKEVLEAGRDHEKAVAALAKLRDLE